MLTEINSVISKEFFLYAKTFNNNNNNKVKANISALISIESAVTTSRMKNKYINMKDHTRY